MNIYEKIQTIRVELKKQNIRMSGYNDFAGYDYFELDDFLPVLNELMQQYKMTAYPSFGTEIATLTAVNCEKPEETVVITSPMGSANLKGCHAVQNIGATETYQRRYLYQALFDISEKDSLNATQGVRNTSSTNESNRAANVSQVQNKTTAAPNGQPLMTEAQKRELKALGSDINNVAAYYKTTADKLTQLQAQQAIDMKKTRAVNGGAHG